MPMKRAAVRAVQRVLGYGPYRLALRRGRHPLIPPPWLHSVGGSDFEKTGPQLLELAQRLAGLKATDRIIDIGSGTGRLALPLTQFLSTGFYEGVDIVRQSVAWCSRAYRPFPNFRFHHADIHNSEYNRGSVRAIDYRFPFDDGSFDFIFLTSVFTHMLAPDVRHYLGEVRRLLAPGGRAFITVFLPNERNRRLIEEGKSRFSFSHRLGESHCEWPEVPERAVAFDEASFLAWCEAAGLDARLVPGRWPSVAGVLFHDFVIIPSE